MGAFGGRREIMEKIAPLGPVYQAGTLSGNPVAMAAGLKTLELIATPGFFEALTENTRRLVDGLRDKARTAGVPLTSNQAGAMFGIFFTDAAKVENFAQSTACNLAHFQAFFHAMLRRGVYLAPSAFEAGFVSSAHSDEDLEATLDAAAEAFAEIA